LVNILPRVSINQLFKNQVLWVKIDPSLWFLSASGFNCS